MKTKEITQGAMCAALYAILLLLNQQTALVLEETAPWLFVFPILIFSAKSNVTVSVCAAIAMALETFFFGGFTTWFYSLSSLLTGLLCGIAIKKGASGSIQLAILFVCQFVGNLLILLLWAGIFDFDYSADFALLQQYIPWLDFKVFLILIDGILSVMTAICIHLVTAALCLRLHIPVAPLRPVSQIVPRKGPALLFLGTLAVFLATQTMVVWSTGLKNALLLLLAFLAVWMDWYGAVFFMDRCVKRGRRGWAPVAIMGAFIPGLNFIWMAAGTAFAIGRKQDETL